MTDIAAWTADIRPAPGCGWFHPMSAYPTHCARCTVTRRMRQGGCYSHGCWDPECTLCGGRLREAVTSGGGELVASGAPDLRRRGVDLAGLPALAVPRRHGRRQARLLRERSLESKAGPAAVPD